MNKNTKENCLIQVIKELRDCLFLLMIMQQKNSSLQELKLKTTTLKPKEEIFMISQLMTRLSNTTKFDIFEQSKETILKLAKGTTKVL